VGGLAGAFVSVATLSRFVVAAAGAAVVAGGGSETVGAVCRTDLASKSAGVGASPGERGVAERGAAALPDGGGNGAYGSLGATACAGVTAAGCGTVTCGSAGRGTAIAVAALVA
jgi:hypothetical protein